MKYVSLYFVFACIVAIKPCNLDAMKRAHEADQASNGIDQLPIDLRRNCLKAMIDIDTPEKLCESLVSLCYANLNGNNVEIIATDKQLADMLAERLAEQDKSLLTLVDVYGQTVLHYAVKKQNILPRVIRVICKASGVSVQQLLCKYDNCGRTALYFASWFGNIANVQSLLDNPGINTFEIICIEDNFRNTALHAAVFGYRDIYGHDVFPPRSPEETERHGNVDHYISTINTLIQASGVKIHQFINMQNSRHRTALDIARGDTGLKNIVDLLESYINQNKKFPCTIL